MFNYSKKLRSGPSFIAKLNMMMLTKFGLSLSVYSKNKTTLLMSLSGLS